ncbi:MAG: hypothetical protein WBB88_02640 [Methyloceanibacter sp.]
MVSKTLSRGRVGYYWQPPTWARERGCPLRSEALGTDFSLAKARCDEVLNFQFDAWRKNETVSATRLVVGTFDWMVGQYKTSPKWRKLAAGTRADYDRSLSLVAQHKLKDGRRFGALSLRSITPGVADRIHEHLVTAGKGQRQRTAKLAMDVCRRAWYVAYRSEPASVPVPNPFSKMGLSYKPRKTRAATLDELNRFVSKADELGHRSIGTAALIAFWWLQREEDIFLRLGWSHYRRPDAPDTVQILHNKTGESVDVPLHDQDGTHLWPDLVPRLDSEPRAGTLLVMREKPDRKRKVHLPWATSASNPVRHVQRVVAQICDAAALSPDITFTSFRHGGHTDAADAGLTDAQIRALSGHKTAAMISVYAKNTKDQRLAGARKRREARRTKGGNLSE